MSYVDGLLKVSLRMNVRKVLNLRSLGDIRPLSIADFHVVLRSEPDLYSHWVDGLRLLFRSWWPDMWSRGPARDRTTMT